MKYYSYAGEARGTSDPENVECVEVEDGGCDLEGCLDDHCHHTVIMWSGNGYNRNHTWIAADETFTIDLEANR